MRPKILGSFQIFSITITGIFKEISTNIKLYFEVGMLYKNLAIEIYFEIFHETELLPKTSKLRINNQNWDNFEEII